MNQQPEVLQSLNNRVLTITLNRPEAKNAITAEMSVALYDAIASAAENDAVGAVVLTGAGGAFCAGGDVKKMNQHEDESVRVYSRDELLKKGGEMAMLLHQMPKPTIAMMRGAAAGGGLSLALGCDLRYADESAKITFAYTNIGLSGDFAGGYLLQKLLGVAKAREFCLFCPVLRALEAEQLGLLNARFSADDLEREVYARAERLANGPTSALGRIKDNLNFADGHTPAEYIAFEADNFNACRESDEHKEALRAFVEKRAPTFHKD